MNSSDQVLERIRGYSESSAEVPNRRADRNKRAGLEKNHPARFFT